MFVYASVRMRLPVFFWGLSVCETLTYGFFFSARVIQFSLPMARPVIDLSKIDSRVFLHGICLYET